MRNGGFAVAEVIDLDTVEPAVILMASEYLSQKNLIDKIISETRFSIISPWTHANFVTQPDH